MLRSPNRRLIVLTAATFPLTFAIPAIAAQTPRTSATEGRFAELEKTSGGRLGVFALDTANSSQVHYRANERFPFCSTFKFILVGTILTRSTDGTGLMQQRIHYTLSDLAHYSPVTSEHIADGMTVAELCRAAIQHSDNTAANQLIKILGGPAAVTAFARSIGDREFRLDRWETELNTAIPGDPRDTSTPVALSSSFQLLVLGDALPVPQREQLADWLRGNTTGANRIRAGIPSGWQVGDKTGSGDYGTANDIAVIWPPARAPIILAVYHTQRKADAKYREDVIAEAARIAVDLLDPEDARRKRTRM